MVRISLLEKTTLGHILGSEGRNKTKRAGLWEPKPESHVAKLTIWEMSFEEEKI